MPDPGPGHQTESGIKLTGHALVFLDIDDRSSPYSCSFLSTIAGMDGCKSKILQSIFNLGS
jgi:hypothetical protein